MKIALLTLPALGAVLMVLVAVALVQQARPAAAQDAQGPCPGTGTPPTPESVAVSSVPIIVESTTDDYFVLYAELTMDAGTTIDLPVAVKRGEAGTTTLSENVAALPAERYRVEKYQIANPADVDGDCVDDLAELDNLGSMNPVNPAEQLEAGDGMVAVASGVEFEAIAYEGRYLKFTIADIETSRPKVYFINTKTHKHHADFIGVLGLQHNEVVEGSVVYSPTLVAPDGGSGLYYLWGGALLQRYGTGVYDCGSRDAPS